MCSYLLPSETLWLLQTFKLPNAQQDHNRTIYCHVHFTKLSTIWLWFKMNLEHGHEILLQSPKSCYWCVMGASFLHHKSLTLAQHMRVTFTDWQQSDTRTTMAIGRVSLFWPRHGSVNKVIKRVKIHSGHLTWIAKTIISWKRAFAFQIPNYHFG